MGQHRLPALGMRAVDGKEEIYLEWPYDVVGANLSEPHMSSVNALCMCVHACMLNCLDRLTYCKF